MNIFLLGGEKGKKGKKEGRRERDFFLCSLGGNEDEICFFVILFLFF